jgi:hypothetical protein
MMSRYVLASSPPGRTSRGRRWVRLLPGEQGEEGEEGEEELKLVGEEEGTQLGLGKAKAMPLLAQQEEGDGTADGEWGRGGGAAVGYIASYKSSSGFACFLRLVWLLGTAEDTLGKTGAVGRQDAASPLPVVGGRVYV